MSLSEPTFHAEVEIKKITKPILGKQFAIFKNNEYFLIPYDDSDSDYEENIETLGMYDKITLCLVSLNDTKYTHCEKDKKTSLYKIPKSAIIDQTKPIHFSFLDNNYELDCNQDDYDMLFSYKNKLEEKLKEKLEENDLNKLSEIINNYNSDNSELDFKKAEKEHGKKIQQYKKYIQFRNEVIKYTDMDTGMDTDNMSNNQKKFYQDYEEIKHIENSFNKYDYTTNATVNEFIKDLEQEIDETNNNIIAEFGKDKSTKLNKITQEISKYDEDLRVQCNIKNTILDTLKKKNNKIADIKKQIQEQCKIKDTTVEQKDRNFKNINIKKLKSKLATEEKEQKTIENNLDTMNSEYIKIFDKLLDAKIDYLNNAVRNIYVNHVKIETETIFYDIKKYKEIDESFSQCNLELTDEQKENIKKITDKNSKIYNNIIEYDKFIENIHNNKEVKNKYFDKFFNKDQAKILFEIISSKENIDEKIAKALENARKSPPVSSAVFINILNQINDMYKKITSDDEDEDDDEDEKKVDDADDAYDFLNHNKPERARLIIFDFVMKKLLDNGANNFCDYYDIYLDNVNNLKNNKKLFFNNISIIDQIYQDAFNTKIISAKKDFDNAQKKFNNVIVAYNLSIQNNTNFNITLDDITNKKNSLKEKRCQYIELFWQGKIAIIKKSIADVEKMSDDIKSKYQITEYFYKQNNAKGFSDYNVYRQQKIQKLKNLREQSENKLKELKQELAKIETQFENHKKIANNLDIENDAIIDNFEVCKKIVKYKENIDLKDKHDEYYQKLHLFVRGTKARELSIEVDNGGKAHYTKQEFVTLQKELNEKQTKIKNKEKNSNITLLFGNSTDQNTQDEMLLKYIINNNPIAYLEAIEKKQTEFTDKIMAINQDNTQSMIDSLNEIDPVTTQDLTKIQLQILLNKIQINDENETITYDDDKTFDDNIFNKIIIYIKNFTNEYNEDLEKLNKLNDKLVKAKADEAKTVTAVAEAKDAITNTRNTLIKKLKKKNKENTAFFNNIKDIIRYTQNKGLTEEEKKYDDDIKQKIQRLKKLINQSLSEDIFPDETIQEIKYLYNFFGKKNNQIRKHEIFAKIYINIISFFRK